MNSTIKQLLELFTPQIVTTDGDILKSYAHDEAILAPYQLPLAVVRPTSSEQLQTLVSFCNSKQLPIIARGAGTGLSGAANAVAGSIVVSFEKMNRIINIDANEGIAIVEPGVVNDDLREACDEQGLWYPPDPASSEWSTIGGNVATNAGGLCCVKYGVTGDFVLGLEVINSSGEKVKIGRQTAKGVAGYDLTSLYVGAEGTLGLVTQITLRLLTRQQQQQTIVGYFDTLEDAGKAVSEVTKAGIIPSALELLDNYCLQAVDKWQDMGLSAEGNILLLGRTDTKGEQGMQEAAQIKDCFDAAGATFSAYSDNPTEADALFEARRLVFPALKQLGQVLTEDICVPRTKVPQMCATIERIAKDNDIYIACIAHAGDGNLHPLIVLPKGDSQANARAKMQSNKAMEQIVFAAIELGGTVTGEHGVGLLKMKGFAHEAGPQVLAMHRAIKKALDPNNIFNPGKVFDMNTIDIRPFDSKYSLAVTNIFYDSIHGISENVYTKVQQNAWAPLPRDYGKWRTKLQAQPPFMAFTNDDLAGFIYMDDTGYIDWLFVDPKFQGQGIANALYNRVYEQAKTQGIDKLSIQASKMLMPMMRGKGFRVVKSQEVEKNGEILVNYLMEMKI